MQVDETAIDMMLGDIKKKLMNPDTEAVEIEVGSDLAERPVEGETEQEYDDADDSGIDPAICNYIKEEVARQVAALKGIDD